MATTKMKGVITGGPFEAGASVWEKMVLPFFEAVKDQPPLRVQQFYAGLLSSCMGAMVADFGHDKAVSILRTLADSLDSMRDDLCGSRTQ